jgi:carboxyl-terminal processing protease
LAAQIAYMLAGTQSNDGINPRIFETSQFNDKYPSTNPVTGQAITPTPFINETIGWQNLAEGLPLPALNLSRVFVLTGSSTCSASEAIINGLRGIDINVIQIGSITCGKPYGFYGTDNCGNTYFTIQLKGVNEKGFGEYADGFKAANSNEQYGVSLPGCSVGDDFEHLLGDPLEARFKAALDYRDFQTCPNPPPFGVSPLGVSKAAPEAGNNDGIVPKSFYDSNRMYDLPTRQ